MSRKLMSPIVRNASPSLFLILRPDLSFFFLDERTLVNVRATLEGNWRGGRWKARESALVSRVLYCSSKAVRQKNSRGEKDAHER